MVTDKCFGELFRSTEYNNISDIFQLESLRVDSIDRTCINVHEAIGLQTNQETDSLLHSIYGHR